MDHSGAVALEYAIVLPALLLLVLGIIDAGRVIWTVTTLNHAVESAARCGAVDAVTCKSPTNIQAYAVTQAYGVAVNASAFTATTTSCGMNVVASLPFTFVVPWIGRSQITLSASACYPL
jgi:Flp pilus assembly protein TadG